MQTKTFTITVFTEDHAGLLSRVVGIFNRRNINISSLTTSQSSDPTIHRFTIVVDVTEGVVQKLRAQLDKQVDVLKAFYYTDEEVVHQEIALYKVPTSAFNNGDRVERIVRKHNARVLLIESEYVVIEKTGHEAETTALLDELRDFGIFEFVRSGRVAVVKPMERLNNYLATIQESAGNV
ncbi:acetolactate synthase small subunit [Neolewinella antarctica]|uniref:Acetolactate synthase small subunit n=1 Tax=Neolewinella antarctica TaxID=442734 RepID=A0ABX0X6C9_9BACT|nr:acetolactate synthase small subunit [Neolewinella antarctica]NJC24766.1 acetolactate synthase-1/3 small subunit [Neolewinella antarctica]